MAQLKKIADHFIALVDYFLVKFLRMFVILDRTSRKDRVVDRSFRKPNGERVFPRSCNFSLYQSIAQNLSLISWYDASCSLSLFLSFSFSRDVRVIGITARISRYNWMPCMHPDDVSYRPMFRAISGRRTKYGMIFFFGEDLLEWLRKPLAAKTTPLILRNYHVKSHSPSRRWDSAPNDGMPDEIKIQGRHGRVSPPPASLSIKFPPIYARWFLINLLLLRGGRDERRV